MHHFDSSMTLRHILPGTNFRRNAKRKRSGARNNLTAKWEVIEETRYVMEKFRGRWNSKYVQWSINLKTCNISRASVKLLVSLIPSRLILSILLRLLNHPVHTTQQHSNGHSNFSLARLVSFSRGQAHSLSARLVNAPSFSASLALSSRGYVFLAAYRVLPSDDGTRHFPLFSPFP